MRVYRFIPLISLILLPSISQSTELISLKELQVKSISPTRFQDQTTRLSFEYGFSKNDQLKSLEIFNSGGKSIEKIFYSEEKIHDDEFHREQLIELEPNDLPEEEKSTPILRIGKAKIEFHHCNDKEFSTDSLLNKLVFALNRGSRCMARASPESRMEALKLRLIFESPLTRIKIFCSHENRFTHGLQALSLTPPEHEFLGILLNTKDRSPQKMQQLSSTLFHEMLHWLYYPHGYEFDTPYVAEICCMNDSAKSTKKKTACDLLQQTPRPKVDSDAYLSSFAKLMIKDQRPFIAARLIKTLLTQKKSSSKNLELYHELSKTLASNGSDIAKILKLSIEKLNPKLAKSSQYRRPASGLKHNSKEDLGIEIAGSLIHELMVDSSYPSFKKSLDHAQKGWHALVQSASTPKERIRLSEQIRGWINEFSEITETIPHSLNPFDPTPQEKWESLEKSF